MTVAELIDLLQKVEKKDAKIMLEGFDCVVASIGEVEYFENIGLNKNTYLLIK